MVPSFKQALEACLAEIPRGSVASCGTVAKALGDLRAARTVAAWLLDAPETEGAYRVVRADGRPVVSGASERLAADGVELSEGRAPVERFTDALPRNHFLDRLRTQQKRLSKRVVEVDAVTDPTTFGGVDVAYVGNRAFAVAVALDARTLEPVDIAAREVDVDFPYIPTYLAYREFPPVEAALRALREKPDLLFVDGHGRLHPALFGFACFVGVRLGVPTIGIAKHLLVGRPDPSSRATLGAAPISLDGVVRGYAWVPPGASRPCFISVGHRISPQGALAAAQRATRRVYPEPLRVADRLSKERKNEKKGEGSTSGKAAQRRPPAQGHPGA